jgi:hypothetical protein
MPIPVNIELNRTKPAWIEMQLILMGSTGNVEILWMNWSTDGLPNERRDGSSVYSLFNPNFVGGYHIGPLRLLTPKFRSIITTIKMILDLMFIRHDSVAWFLNWRDRKIRLERQRSQEDGPNRFCIDYLIRN